MILRFILEVLFVMSVVFCGDMLIVFIKNWDEIRMELVRSIEVVFDFLGGYLE